MSEIRLGATVTDKGGLKPDSAPVWAASLSKLAGKRVTVTIQPEATRRSKKQNDRYWSLIVPIFQQIWSEGRVALSLPGYTKQEVHRIIKAQILGEDEGPLPGTHVEKQTRNMDTKEFAKFTEEAEQLLWQQYRVPVPDGDWSAVEA